MSTSDTDARSRLEQIHLRLEAAVGEVASGEDWEKMLRCASRFHSYSSANLWLIASQRPDATRVCGYRTWQALGRQVRRGEHGIAILAPLLYRTGTERDLAETREPDEKTKVLRGFRVAYVFDISQTEGEPLAEVAPVLLEGDAPGELYWQLAKQVSYFGFATEEGDCSSANGQTDFHARTVTLRPGLSPAQVTKTLCHELAHIRLGHEELVGAQINDPGCRGQAEVEAESVAFVVCETAGLDTGSYSFPYVARWAGGDVSVVKDTAQKVVRVSRGILFEAGLLQEDAIRPERGLEPPSVPEAAGASLAAEAGPACMPAPATEGPSL